MFIQTLLWLYMSMRVNIICLLSAISSCRSIYNYGNSSSYGALRVVEATTPKPPTPPGEGRTSEITDSPLHGSVEFTTDQNTFIETQPRVEVTTPKLSSKFGQITDKRTVRTDEYKTDLINIISNQSTAPSKQGTAVTVIISVVIALIIICSGVIIKSFLHNKRKIKRKMKRNAESVRTNLAEESPSNIL